MRIHRPERSWPRSPEQRPVELAALPARHEGGSRLAQLLPLLGSVAMVGFVFVIQSVAELVLMGTAVVVMVGGGLATTVVQSRARRRGFARTRQRYLAHLEEARLRAAGAAAAQRAALETWFPDPARLCEIAADGDRLWERRPRHDDFAAVRLGRGRVAASCPVVLARDEGPLADPDPDLADAADRLVAETQFLESAPVLVPLRRLGCVAVVGAAEPSRALVGAWLAGLATFHAPAELRITGLVPGPAARAWDWLKWLPHARDPEAGEGMGRIRRAVTPDPAAFGIAIEDLVRRRLELLRRSDLPAASLESGQPGAAAGHQVEHVVVVVDGYQPGAAPPALEALLPVAAAVGVSVIVLVGHSREVPATCGARVEWADAQTVRYVESGRQGRVETDVAPDQIGPGPASRLARTLAPLALQAGEIGADLADPVRLVELLGADEAAQLDLPASWHSLTALRGGLPPGFLTVPIGRGDDGSPLLLDLKEAAAGGLGPHGLLVGATGSGKSELLRSVTAAIAARHDPALVNLLLIDFKGGAAFAELADLPHVAGLVTNLAGDLSLVDRMRHAIGGELTRRQEMLRMAGNFASVADYQAARAAGALLDPLPYLVIVVDEFGELLAARPDFLDAFVTVARLGRSLGVHLLLASQRLDEGRIRGLEPHLRYRLCLRTFTAEESRAVLGTSDAFELAPLPGLGYLRVDASKTRFKAAICSSGRTVPVSPNGVRTLGDGEAAGLVRPFSVSGQTPDDLATGHNGALQGSPGTNGAAAVVRRVADVRALLQSAARQADSKVIVQLASEAADCRARQIWTEPLPGSLTLGALAAMAGELAEGGEAEPGVAVGLADLPARQRRQAVTYRPDGPGGNVAVVGAPRSGKSTLLQALVLALATGAGPDRRQVYCLDLGGGGLFELARLPHVGAVIGRGESGATARLFRDLRALLDERADQRRTGVGTADWAEVFLVVDNVGQLRQSAPDLEPELTELATAGLPFRVHVVVSANRWFDIRPQLLDALGTRWELHLADPADSLAGRHAAASVPAGVPGRGLTRDGHLFQAALPVPSGEPSPGSLTEAVASIAAGASGARAPAIADLPQRVTSAQAAELSVLAGSAPPARDGGFLLGVSEFRGRPVQIDLARGGSSLLVYGDSGSGRTTLLRRVTAYLQGECQAAAAGVAQTPVTLLIVDPVRGLIDLAESPAVAGYAASAAAAEKLAGELASELLPRMPSADATVAELRAGQLWRGSRYVLIADDYDLLLGSMGGPFVALADLVAHAADVGLSVVVARRVAGSQRTAFEPFTQRLREVAGHTLIMSGQRDEGPLAAGVTARIMPPGRGVLVSGRARPQLVQCCLDDDRRVHATGFRSAQVTRQAGS